MICIVPYRIVRLAKRNLSTVTLDNSPSGPLYAVPSHASKTGLPGSVMVPCYGHFCAHHRPKLKSTHSKSHRPFSTKNSTNNQTYVVTCIRSRKRNIFSSCDHKLLPMTLSIKHDLDGVRAISKPNI